MHGELARASASSWRPGPVTAYRVRRTGLLYAALVAIGFMPWLFDGRAGAKAFGLGLLAPGFGFLAVGDWWLLGLPATLLVFAAALFAWFGAGALLFPVLVWLGSALLAAAVVSGPPSPSAPAIALVVLTAAAGATAASSRRQERRLRALGAARASVLPSALRDARLAATAAAPREGARELDDGQLASLRFLLDRALQPVGEFAGFNRIDQFQTAALRYQINFLGYALGQVHLCCLPAMRGCVSRAQTQLIDKALLPEVWRYWVLETLWGRFRTDFDPADVDNVMLTGYLGAQVGLYTKVSGDTRYERPGGLTFRLSRRRSYPHDLHSLMGSVTRNMEASAFSLYPCEPNWIYPACNFRAMNSLVVYDSLYGTGLVERYKRRWLDALASEFSDASGTVIGLRSSLTGMALPFPTGDLNYAWMASLVDEELGERLWAQGRRALTGLLDRTGEGVMLAFPDVGLDLGNYRPGARAMAMGGILLDARNRGDEEMAAAAQATLDRLCHPVFRGGALSYGGSTMTNAVIAHARLTGRGDAQRAYAGPAPASAGSGPLLLDAPYPDVLVAAAHSDADQLTLVLAPGDRADRPVKLQFGRLRARAAYRIAETGAVLHADAEGNAACEAMIRERTRMTLTPCG